MQKIDWSSVKGTTNGGGRPPVGGYVLTIVNATENQKNNTLKSNGITTRGEWAGHNVKNATENGWRLPRMFRSYKRSALDMMKDFLIALEKSNRGWNMDRWNSLPDAQLEPRP